ncbi:glycosyltransferase family 2 protein [Methylobacterium mesophilicum]
MEPLISVIIPNYNYAAYVSQAIESVLKQTYSNFELFVIDDGSTDGSRNIINKYAGLCNVVYLNNSGQLNACRAVSHMVRGEYVYVLDSDDYLIDHTVFSSIQSMLKQRPAKIQFKLMPVDENSVMIGDPFPGFPDDYDTPMMIKEVLENASYLTPPTSGNIYRKDVWDLVNTVHYHDYADGIAYLAAPFFGEVTTIFRPLACYRLHAKNHSAFRPDLDKTNDKINVITSRITHLKTILTTEFAKKIKNPNDYFMVSDLSLCRDLLQGGKPSIRCLLKHLSNLTRANLPYSKKFAFAIWIISICFLPVHVSSAVAKQRISPRQRNFFMKIISRS